MPKHRTTLFVVAAVLFLLLVPLPLRGRLWEACFDVGHLVIGAALAFLAARFLGMLGMRSSWLRDAGALVLAVLAGIGLEWIQGFIGRSPSWTDAATNAAGAGAWFLAHRARLAPTSALRRAAQMGTALLILAGITTPAIRAFDAVRQVVSFPLLASFEDRLELSRVGSREATFSVSAQYASDGASSLRVELQVGVYPGVSIGSIPEDWTDYEALAFDLVVLGDEPLRLTFEVEDQHHDREAYDYYDRFRRIYTLEPGRHSMRIPLADVRAAPAKRRLNLSRMAGLIWYADGLKAPRTFHLDNVRLVAD